VQAGVHPAQVQHVSPHPGADPRRRFRPARRLHGDAGGCPGAAPAAREHAAHLWRLRASMTTQPPIRLAVLLSKAGTSLQNFLDRCADGRMKAQIVAVVSNNANAFGLERARRAKIPTFAVNRKEAGSVAEFSRRLFAPCREVKADLVCLAGFLQ